MLEDFSSEIVYNVGGLGKGVVIHFVLRALEPWFFPALSLLVIMEISSYH